MALSCGSPQELALCIVWRHNIPGGADGRGQRAAAAIRCPYWVLNVVVIVISMLPSRS